MTHPALIERITRSLAYMLRHQPEKFDLELDSHGFGPMADVVRALQERLGEPVDETDVEAAVEAGDRPRYEVREGRIRALYGHSIEVEPGEPARPPEFLYVGIDARDLGRAQQFGLRGGRRRFLHLALNLEDAREAGRRAAREYSVLRIYALDAWEDGVNFFDRRALYLAEHVPTEYIEVLESAADGYEERSEDAGSRRGGARSGGGRGDARRDRSEGRDRRPRGGQDRGFERGHSDHSSGAHRPAERVREREERAPVAERRPDREREFEDRGHDDRRREDAPWAERTRDEGARGDAPRRDAPRRDDRGREDSRREDGGRDEYRRDEPRRDFGRGGRGRDEGRFSREPRSDGPRRYERAPAAEDRSGAMEAPVKKETVVRATAAPGPDFGLGIFDEAPVKARPAPVEAERRSTPPPAPPPPPKDPYSDFGAGV